MAYIPATTNVTQISGPVITIASSATAVALTFGREHEVTGSAAQTLTIATPTVNGTVVNVKVADSYTGAGVTMPAGMTQAGVLTAGMEFQWVWDGTIWNEQ
jgi:hypothetical protein